MGLFQKPYANRDSLRKQSQNNTFVHAKFRQIYQSRGGRDVFLSRPKSLKWRPQGGRNQANRIVSGTPPRRYASFLHQNKVGSRRYGGKTIWDGIWDGRSSRRYARVVHQQKNSSRRHAGF